MSPSSMISADRTANAGQPRSEPWTDNKTWNRVMFSNGVLGSGTVGAGRAGPWQATIGHKHGG